MNRLLYAGLAFGKVSYAEVSLLHDVLLGVTGDAKQTLERVYDIRRFSCRPSDYGDNKLVFAGATEQDVHLCDTEDDHFLEIKNEIDRRRMPWNPNTTPCAVSWYSLIARTPYCAFTTHMLWSP
ncbi:hypothetical protein ACA910_001169 [Epithemia clementina (nom. ined.)]